MNSPTSLSYWELLSFWGDPDFTIIGCGIVGLNTALTLRKLAPKAKINIVERGFFPEGASTRNAGFACFGSISELVSDLQNSTEKEVYDLIKMRYDGFQKLRSIVGDRKMDYRSYGGFEIFDKADQINFEKFAARIPYFNNLITSITNNKSTYQFKPNHFGLNVHKELIVNTEEGQIDTGKALKELIGLARRKNINIIFGIKIDKIDGANLITESGINLKSGHIIVCTNGFAKRLLPNIEVIPARNIVLVTTPIPNLKIKGAFHYKEGYYYFRNIGNRILIGGGRNEDFENEMVDDFGNNSMIETKLKTLLYDILLPKYTTIEIEYQWSGILGIGKSKMPIIEKINPSNTIAVRMGGMGVAIGSLVGEKAAKIAIGKS
jgi:gamma-glutamylputrescine oxidase